MQVRLKPDATYKHSRRLDRVYVAGTLLLIVSYGARLALSTSAAWMNLAAWLTSFV
jgi:hypothetical protein